jgi:hypothetical protein
VSRIYYGSSSRYRNYKSSYSNKTLGRNKYAFHIEGMDKVLENLELFKNFDRSEKQNWRRAVRKSAKEYWKHRKTVVQKRTAQLGAEGKQKAGTLRSSISYQPAKGSARRRHLTGFVGPNIKRKPEVRRYAHLVQHGVGGRNKSSKGANLGYMTKIYQLGHKNALRVLQDETEDIIDAFLRKMR